jgi:diguanylate cyclase (GGDEF)-like protein
MSCSVLTGSSVQVAAARPLVIRYGASVLGTGLAAGLWLLIGHRLAPSPFLLFTAAVALAAWWGGLGPALMAMGISTVACLLLYDLAPGRPGFTAIQAAPDLLTFLLVSVVITALQEARHRAVRALADQALHDPLTGLPNRRLFADRLQRLLSSSRRTSRPFALVLLDLDGFKEVNDTFGHLQGDRVLREVAHRLHAHARSSDTIARVGGDEFALLFPEMDEESARTMLGKLTRLFVQPVLLDGREFRVGASMGLAVYPADGTSAERLVERADAAMYRTKRAAALDAPAISPAGSGHRTGASVSLLPRTTE